MQLYSVYYWEIGKVENGHVEEYTTLGEANRANLELTRIYGNMLCTATIQTEVNRETHTVQIVRDIDVKDITALKMLGLLEKAEQRFKENQREAESAIEGDSSS